ncbi:EamA family transporter [bacterium]|nr:EamA family transporter [bacterium]
MHVSPAGQEKLRATLGGLAAAVLWSSAVAAGRRLTELFGGLGAVALIHAVAAVMSLAYLALSPSARKAVLSGSRRYLLGCGALFVVYVLCFYRALDAAAGREQVLVVGIINYLWPAFSLLLSVPILGQRTSLPALLAASLVALLGVALALGAGGTLSAGVLAAALRGGWAAYIPALAAAILWGLYNNLSRRWGGGDGSGAVPLFILATAILLSPNLVLLPHDAVWNVRAVALLLFVALCPTFLAYFLWDRAERRGHHSTVNALAYGIPVASTLLTGWLLDLRVPSLTWAGCALVILGAAFSRLVILDKESLAQVGGKPGLGEIIRLNLGFLRRQSKARPNG